MNADIVYLEHTVTLSMLSYALTVQQEHTVTLMVLNHVLSVHLDTQHHTKAGAKAHIVQVDDILATFIF